MLSLLANLACVGSRLAFVELLHCLDDICVVFAVLKSVIAVTANLGHMFAIILSSFLVFPVTLLLSAFQLSKRVAVVADEQVLSFHPGHSNHFGLFVKLKGFLNKGTFLLGDAWLIDLGVAVDLIKVEEMWFVEIEGGGFLLFIRWWVWTEVMVE